MAVRGAHLGFNKSEKGFAANVKGNKISYCRILKRQAFKRHQTG